MTGDLRELDAWIAIHLFDMHEFEPNSTNNCICDSCGKNNSFIGHFRKDWVQFSSSLPRYTTDAAAALQVLEKIAVGSELTHMTKLGDQWNIFKGSDDNFRKRVKAETLPLAICRFARKVVEK